MKLVKSNYKCMKCDKSFVLIIDNHQMCVGCNFKSEDRRYFVFTLNGWTFRDLGHGIEVEQIQR